MTQPLAAVYKTRNTDTGQAKYGHVWLKDEKEAVTQVKAKGTIDKGEVLEAVWTVEWRDPESDYRLVFADAGNELFPSIDVAAQLRERFLKKRMGKKERRNLIATVLQKKVDRKDWWCCSTGTCNTSQQTTYKYVDPGMEPLNTPQGVWRNPWYTIKRAPLKEKQ